MSIDTHGILTEGARRVWRYQRVLWWIVAVNLVLAYLGVYAGGKEFGSVLDHSRHAERLSSAFDLFAFVELLSKPEIQFESVQHNAMHFSIVFFVFSLFLTGGIIEAYRAGRRLTMAEFFHACAVFFWRWVRLLIFLLIVMAPIVIMGVLLSDWSSTLSDDAPQERLGFAVEVAGLIAVVLLSMIVRVWFDLAQTRTVLEDERRVRRSVGRAFRILRKNFGPLLWIYFRISLVAWAGLALAVLVWSRIPPRHFQWSAWLLELVVFLWIATRLWQRASEVAWYERWQIAQSSPADLAHAPAAPSPALQ